MGLEDIGHFGVGEHYSMWGWRTLGISVLRTLRLLLLQDIAVFGVYWRMLDNTGAGEGWRASGVPVLNQVVFFETFREFIMWFLFSVLILAFFIVRAGSGGSFECV